MDQTRQIDIGEIITELRVAQTRIEQMVVDEEASAVKKRLQYASIDLETAVEHLRRALAG